MWEGTNNSASPGPLGVNRKCSLFLYSFCDSFHNYHYLQIILYNEMTMIRLMIVTYFHQASLYYDTRHFLRFKDISIHYKHYEENSGPSTDPLIIQAVPLWAKMEGTVSGDPSEKLQSLQETSDEGELVEGQELYNVDQFLLLSFIRKISKDEHICCW